MNTLKFEQQLAEQYKYKPLPKEVSKEVRAMYKNNIPSSLSIQGGGALYTSCGTLITNNYNRIVIGDYGAFIEFNNPNYDKLITAPGQLYHNKMNNRKYDWLTINDQSDIKIYYQKHSVTYADYIPGKYYVSVYEVIAERN